MSKGDKPRPLSVPLEDFATSFDRIFGKQKMCGLCQKPVDKCGCVPTDDGPGQEEAEESKRPPYDRRKHNREGV